MKSRRRKRLEAIERMERTLARWKRTDAGAFTITPGLPADPVHNLFATREEGQAFIDKKIKHHEKAIQRTKSKLGLD
jgi:uncharacterized protein (DUF305 family)